MQDIKHLKGDARANAKEWEFKLPVDEHSGSSGSGSSGVGTALSMLGVKDTSASSGAPVPFLGIKNLGNTCKRIACELN